MNIENFKNSFDSLARTNLFRVRGFGLPNSLEFRVKSTTKPTDTIGTIEIPYSGRKVKIAGDRTYEPWTFTVYNATNFDVYEEIVDWQNSINAPVENVGVNSQAYKRDGVIEFLDNNENVIKTVEIIGGWPAIIGEVTLDWESENEVQTFDVTLEYDYHI